MIYCIFKKYISSGSLTCGGGDELSVSTNQMTAPHEAAGCLGGRVGGVLKSERAEQTIRTIIERRLE